MTVILITSSLVALGLGFYLGREAGKAPGVSTCPKCQQRRFHYCGSCGVHFDEADEPLSHKDHPSWMDPGAIPEDTRRH